MWGHTLKTCEQGDKVYILFISEGVSGRFKDNQEKCKKEIIKRQKWQKKSVKLGKFQIIDFLNLKNLQLNSYPQIIII